MQVNPFFARRGVSFLFKEQDQFINPQLALRQQDESTPLKQRDRHNQMFNCSDDLQQIVILSLDDYIIGKLASLLDANFYPLELQSLFLLFWNLLVYFTVMIIFIENMFTVVILSWTYEQQVNPIFTDWQKTIIFIGLLVDIMFVRIRISMQVRGRRLRTHKDIIQYYFTHYFLIDIAAVIIMVVDVFTHAHLTLLKTIFYVKIYSMLQINTQLSYKLRYYSKSIAFYRFLKYSFFLVYYSFFISATYVMVSIWVIKQDGFQYQNGFTWLTGSFGLQRINIYTDFQWYVWQQYAIFLFMQTARGCGYGVISPRNPPQMLLVSYGTLLIIVGFGYYTNGIMNIIAKLEAEKDLIGLETEYLNILRKNNPFSFRVYDKYRVFIVYSKNRRRKKVIDIMREFLPDQLFQQFSYVSKQYYLLRFTLLSHINIEDNQQFIVDVSQLVKLKGAYQGELLYSCNQLSKRILYLSQHKQIVTKNRQLNYFNLNKEWDFIGTREFYIDAKPMFDIFVLNSVTLEYIEKQQFLAVLKKYKNIYELFWLEIDGIKVEGKSTDKIQLNCWGCQGYHIYQNCPYFNNWKKQVDLKGNPSQQTVSCNHQRIKTSRQQLSQQKILNLHHILPHFDEVYTQCTIQTSFNL